MVITMETLEIPLDLERRWEWIKYQLRVRNSSTAKVARALGVHDRALRTVKRHAYPRIERAIAEVLNLHPIQLWPERWNTDGTPRRQRPNRAECNSESKNTGYGPVGNFKTAQDGQI